MTDRLETSKPSDATPTAAAVAPPPGAGRGAGRPWVKIAIGLGLGALFLYLFLRGADLAAIGRALVRADPFWVAVSLGAAAIGLVFRAARWQCLLRPVKRVGLRPSFEILNIGYLFSNYLPGRVGDLLVRPVLMGRSERVSKVAVLATIAVERLFDTVTVGLCFAGYLALFPRGDLGIITLEQARRIGYLTLLGCAVVVIGLLALRLAQERALGLLGRLLRPLPARISGRVLEHARSFATGLDLFHDGRTLVLSVVHSALAWTVTGIMMWAAAMAVGLPVRPVDGALLLSIGALGVAVPTPGGVGPFEFFLLQALLAIGVTDREGAQASAILMHVLSLIPITVFGLYSMWRRGVHVADVQEAAE